jgi:hypothetical protein
MAGRWLRRGRTGRSASRTTLRPRPLRRGRCRVRWRANPTCRSTSCGDVIYAPIRGAFGRGPFRYSPAHPGRSGTCPGSGPGEPAFLAACCLGGRSWREDRSECHGVAMLVRAYPASAGGPGGIAAGIPKIRVPSRR